MKIYISGPITGTDDYQERFSAAEQVINAYGDGDIVAVNPVKETAGIPEGSPWETYMKACMKILADCDAIYMLDGWTGSRGARLEYFVAMELGLRGMTEFIILSRGDIMTLCKDKPVKVWIDKRPMLLCSDEYFEKQKAEWRADVEVQE